MHECDDCGQPAEPLPEGRYWWAILAILLVFVLGSIYVMHHAKPVHRPQVSVLPMPGPAPVILESRNEYNAPDLKPSVDLPQEAPNVQTPDTQAEATEVDHDNSVQASSSHHDHARRRHHHFRPSRHHHHAETRCEPLCEFFKATAWAAGLIP